MVTNYQLSWVSLILTFSMSFRHSSEKLIWFSKLRMWVFFVIIKNLSPRSGIIKPKKLSTSCTSFSTKVINSNCSKRANIRYGNVYLILYTRHKRPKGKDT